MARRLVTMRLSESFFNKFDSRRREEGKKLGIRKLSHVKFSEMIARRPSKFPDLLRKSKR